jgi:hypothetical protein
VGVREEKKRDRRGREIERGKESKRVRERVCWSEVGEKEG